MWVLMMLWLHEVHRCSQGYRSGESAAKTGACYLSWRKRFICGCLWGIKVSVHQPLEGNTTTQNVDSVHLRAVSQLQTNHFQTPYLPSSSYTKELKSNNQMPFVLCPWLHVLFPCRSVVMDMELMTFHSKNTNPTTWAIGPTLPAVVVLELTFSEC